MVSGSVPDARPSAEVDPAREQAGQQAEALGHLERRVVRQHHAAAADADPLGRRRHRAGQHLGRRPGQRRGRGARRASSGGSRGGRPAAPGRACCCSACGRSTPSGTGVWSSTLSRMPRLPRLVERLQQQLGGLRAGDAVAAVEHEERHAADADPRRELLVGVDGVGVRLALRARRAPPAASRPTSVASRTSVSVSPTGSPSVKYARMRRSFIASWRPCVAARWIRRWASKLLPPRVRSRWYSSPSPAAISVICALVFSACSTLMPYLAARCSAEECVRSGGALGSSWKLRQVSSTSSRCANRSSACSRRRLPT